MAKKNFEGTAEVYNESFYINTHTGEGVDKVLKKIDPLLCKMAAKTFIAGSAFEDIKQDLAIMAIEGIKAFNPEKNAKLSTFLTSHLIKKNISKIRSKNKISSDAFHLYNKDVDICDCGGVILFVDDKKICNDCGLSYNSKYLRARSELNFSQCGSKISESGEEIQFVNSLSEDDALYKNNLSQIKRCLFDLSFEKISSKIDSKTLKVIELVCYDDYTIKDAAEKVGLSGWAASMRIKKLMKRKYFRDILKDSGATL